ncbi:MAG: ATP-binding protein [Saprospiraceae bacterium]
MKFTLKSNHFWKTLSRQGVAAEFKEENIVTSHLNQAAILTSSTAFLVFSIAVFTLNDKYYSFITGLLTILYLVIPVLHHFRKIWWARFYIAAILPIWISLTILLIGGFFSQGIAIMATIALTFVFYEQRPKLQFWLLLYDILLYIVPVAYIAFFPPLLGERDYPLDEVAVFLVSIAWISVIASIYKNEKENFIRDLTENNRKLQGTTEELERFTYIASHDLKSPLRTIISFLDLIDRDLKAGKMEEVPGYLEFAKSGAHQLNFIIRDVLEISKVNSKVYKEMAWVKLNDIVYKAIANLKKDILDRKAVIQYGEMPAYYGNEVELLLLCQNLIQNAIKYNESETPTVKVRGQEENGHYLLHIEDNGIGIEEEYHGLIFEHFKRLHNSQHYQGTGLGLALCKKIAQGYNGSILVRSEPGFGSTFTVRLPLNPHTVNG